MPTLGVIGAAGNMASAMIGGILREQRLSPDQVAVCGRMQEKLEPLRAKGLPVYENPADLVRACAYVILSVRPQSMEELLHQIAPAVGKETVLISVAAGITSEQIRRAVGFPCRVVIAMPNTPLLVGQGAVVLARVEPISDDAFNFVRELFSCSGVVEQVPEAMVNEVTPIHGCSPAAVYFAAKTMCAHAKQLGIEERAAKRLFCGTLIGAATMMLESDQDFDALIADVCSPGGVTIKGMEALAQHGFAEAMVAAYDACVNRSYELEKQPSNGGTNGITASD